jgi:hypothetical protein
MIGLMVTLLMTKPAKALDDYIPWTASEIPRGLAGTLPNPETASMIPAKADGHDRAIEVHQGGQDGGGALWYTMASTQ